jgi:hypothetical protein
MHSLDRINNDGDYTPKNCRWANATVQNNNRRNSIAKVLGVLQRRSTGGDLSEVHIPGRTQRNPRQALSANIKRRRSAKVGVTATGERRSRNENHQRQRRETKSAKPLVAFSRGCSGPRPRLRDVLRLPFALGGSELLKLLLAHRAIHFLRSALKAAGACLSTFGSERSARGFLLGSRFSWHVELPFEEALSKMPSRTTPRGFDQFNFGLPEGPPKGHWPKPWHGDTALPSIATVRSHTKSQGCHAEGHESG